MPSIRLITHKGVTDTLNGWSKRTGISHGTLYQRLVVYGWLPSKALTTPARLKAPSVGPRKRKQAVLATPTATAAVPAFEELKRQHLAARRQFNSLLRQFNRDLHALMGRGVVPFPTESRPDRLSPVTRGLS